MVTAATPSSSKSRKSDNVIVIPLFKKANSRIRAAIISKLYSVASKIVASGLKVTSVPVSFDSPTTLTSYKGFPIEYSC